MRDSPCEAGFVPTVSPRFQRKLILPERLLTIREAAERLNISRASLYKLCAQNQVAYVRVGNAIRFAPEDLSGFLRAGRKALR
jgi:excisionase family DNA binding protein